MGYTIRQGETKQIIGPDEADEDYEVRVGYAPVRLSHQKQQAPKGREYDAGKRFLLEDLKGQPVYAHAPEGDVELDIDVANFLATMFPDPPVAPKGIQVDVDAGNESLFNELRLGEYRGRVDVLWLNQDNPQSATTSETVDLTINVAVPANGPDVTPVNQIHTEITRDGYGVEQLDLSPYEVAYLSVDATNSADGWVAHMATGGLQ